MKKPSRSDKMNYTTLIPVYTRLDLLCGIRKFFRLFVMIALSGVKSRQDMHKQQIVYLIVLRVAHRFE